MALKSDMLFRYTNSYLHINFSPNIIKTFNADKNGFTDCEINAYISYLPKAIR